MKDTSSEIERIQKEIFYKKSISERLSIGVQMIEEGKKFVEFSIKSSNKNISQSDLKIEVFRRFYAKDFSESQLEIIINSFRRSNK